MFRGGNLNFVVQNILIWIIIFLLVTLSSFFSASEIALSSCNKLRIKKKAADGDKRAKMVLSLHEQYGKVLTSLLIGNTVLNIIVSTIGAVVFTYYFEAFGPGISTIFFTVVLLVFAEIIPKTYANPRAEDVCMKNVYFMRFSKILFTPLIFLFEKIRFIVNRFNNIENVPEITEQEIKFMLEEIKGKGVLEDSEGKLARSALDLDEIIASEVMTPRVDLVAVDFKKSVEEIKEVFLKEKYSRIPVFKENIDNVVGILSEKDFFREYLTDRNFQIEDIVEKALFIPPQINISQLMNEFQKSKTHMAIVVDQYGGVEGIITFEDVIKQLVGDIYDEKNMYKGKDILKIGENEWKVNPDISVNVMFREIEQEGFIDLEQSSTVGGWILENLGKLPKVGDGLKEDIHFLQWEILMDLFIKILKLSLEKWLKIGLLKYTLKE